MKPRYLSILLIILFMMKKTKASMRVSATITITKKMNRKKKNMIFLIANGYTGKNNVKDVIIRNINYFEKNEDENLEQNNPLKQSKQNIVRLEN